MTSKVVLSFSAEVTYRSLIYDLIKQYDIRINILKAEIEAGKNGKMVAEFEAAENLIKEGIQYLEANNVNVTPLSSKISVDSSKCVSCGACASACFSQALTISAPDWKLKFNPEKCIVCKLCLTACPLKLFHIEFA